MAEKADGDYIRLSGVTCWMDPKTDEIHVTFNDPDLHHEKTGDGARTVFNANVKSANYHPSNYNRFGDTLRLYGCTAPAAHVPEGPRRIDKRFKLPKASTASIEAMALLDEARPMMESKCCHYGWCIQRTGIISDDLAEGFSEIVDGMHPGCAPYRQWLDRVDKLASC